MVVSAIGEVLDEYFANKVYLIVGESRLIAWQELLVAKELGRDICS